MVRAQKGEPIQTIFNKASIESSHVSVQTSPKLRPVG